MLYDRRLKKTIKPANATVTALRAALEIISDGSKWTCGFYAQSRDGSTVEPLDEKAISFCSIGSLAVAMNVEVCLVEDSQPARFLCAAAREKNFNHATKLNDQGGHSAALWMFDRAIELAEGAA